MTRWNRVFCCLLLLLGVAVAADEAERKIKEKAEPDYPALASKMNLHGGVKLKAWVSSEGLVQRVEYIGGHPLLAESAIKAVKNWKYEKASKESVVLIEIKF